MKLYHEWKTLRQFHAQKDFSLWLPDKELNDMNSSELCDVLGQFFIEICKQNGKEYPRETVYEILMAVQVSMSMKGRYVKFLDDLEFVKLCNTLNNYMIALSKGEICAKQQAGPITLSQEQSLWQQGILGLDSPRKLVDTLLYLISLQFRLRAKEEHKALKIGVQLHVKTDSENGLKYLEYCEASSKNHQGGIKDLKCVPKVCRAYQNTANPDQCIMSLFKKYVSMRPDTDIRCSTDFYLRPLAAVNKYGIGYSVQPQGIHAIESTVGHLCKEGGIPRYKTNHSLRAMCATHMFAQGMDEHLICQRTCHSSNAVHNYK